MTLSVCCLLYTSDAADERSSVDLGGRRIIKKKNKQTYGGIHERVKNYTMKLQKSTTIHKEAQEGSTLGKE